MSETRRSARCVAWLLVVTTCVLGAADASARGGLERYLPEDTFVYISANDLSSYRQKFEGTALYDIGQEPSVRRIMDRIEELLGEKVEQELGLSMKGADHLFTGQVVLAMTHLDLEEEVVGGALVADIEPDKVPQLKELLSALKVRLRGAIPLGMEETFTHGGTEVVFYEVGDSTLCYSFPRDKFVATIGTDRSPMEELLDNLARPPRASLARHPEFRNVFARIGERSHSFSFFNVGGLIDLLQGLTEDEDLPGMIEALGFKGVKSIGLSSTVVDKGFRDIVYIHSPGRRTGLMNLLARQRNLLEVLPYFPEGVSSVSAVGINFPEVWREFKAILNHLEPDDADGVEERIAEFEAELGLSIEKDILGMFRGPVAVGVSGVPMPMPQILVAAKLREGAKPEHVIGRLLAAAGQELTETEYSGHRIFSWTLERAFVMPSYTVHGDCLLFSISPQVLQSTLSRLTSATPSKSAADNSLLREALTRVPTPQTAFSYSDTAMGFNTMYMAILPILQFQQQDLPINLAELPPAEDITKHLFPGVSSMIADREGSTSTSYGPFGGASLFGVGRGAPVLAAIAVANFLPKREITYAFNREANQRASCQNNLKQMGVVFKMYANESKGEKFPMIDGRRGNLAPEGEQIFPEYLSDLHVLRCPSDPDGEPISSPQTPDGITDDSYFYLGWVVTTEEEGLALLDAYESLDLTQRDEDIKVAAGKGSVGGDVIFRLREGIERFFITDINNPAGSALMQSSIPVMWGRPENHSPEGANVLYMDGHVEFVKYPGEFPMTVRFMERLEEVSAKKSAQ